MPCSRVDSKMLSIQETICLDELNFLMRRLELVTASHNLSHTRRLRLNTRIIHESMFCNLLSSVLHDVIGNRTRSWK